MYAYLLNESPLVILPSLAVLVGVNEAIMLQQIHYWVTNAQRSKKNSTHLHDDRWWVYNTYPQWQENFPFWSISKIRRTIGSLERSGLVLSSNYNKDSRDRTKWYAIDYAALDRLIQSKNEPVQNEQMPPKNQKASVQNEESICSEWTDATAQNEQMHLLKMNTSSISTDTNYQILLTDTNDRAPKQDSKLETEDTGVKGTKRTSLSKSKESIATNQTSGEDQNDRAAKIEVEMTSTSEPIEAEVIESIEVKEGAIALNSPEFSATRNFESRYRNSRSYSEEFLQWLDIFKRGCFVLGTLPGSQKNIFDKWCDITTAGTPEGIFKGTELFFKHKTEEKIRRGEAFGVPGGVKFLEDEYWLQALESEEVRSQMPASFVRGDKNAIKREVALNAFNRHFAECNE